MYYAVSRCFTNGYTIKHVVEFCTDIPPRGLAASQIVAPVTPGIARAVLEAAGYLLVPPGEWVNLTMEST